jgi:RHS repeat-associated protein
VDFTEAGGQSGMPQFFWYLKDALGSVAALKDSTDAVVERYVYDPYGKTTITNTSGTPLSANGDCNALEVASAYGNPFGWTGQRYDPRVGLCHFVFRSYSPSLGRWLQRDPVEYADSASLYEYAGSNPGARIDRLGDAWNHKQGCPTLLRRIQNIQRQIDERRREYDANNKRWTDGDQRRIDHWNIIEALQRLLAKYRQEYNDKGCDDWSGPMPPPLPEWAPRPNPWNPRLPAPQPPPKMTPGEKIVAIGIVVSCAAQYGADRCLRALDDLVNRLGIKPLPPPPGSPLPGCRPRWQPR